MYHNAKRWGRERATWFPLHFTCSILHSRSVSRYIEFQTWILSQEQEEGMMRRLKREVELTQSPGTGSREKENCLGIGILLSRARRFLLFDARFAFHGLHPPFCREENHRGRAFFAMTRLPFEASPSLFLSLALSREIVRIQLFHRPMEILEEEGETKQGREASKLMDSSR